MGVVFQDPDSQLFSSSVYQDVSFGAVNLKLPEKEIRRRVDAALERTGILHLKDKPTHCLSFGQKKTGGNCRGSGHGAEGSCI